MKRDWDCIKTILKTTAQAKDIALTLDSIGWLAKHVVKQLLG